MVSRVLETPARLVRSRPAGPSVPSVASEQPLKWFPEHDRLRWFHEHYDAAAREIMDFFGAEGITLTGRRVADIGCGDGIIDLGVFRRTRPLQLTGFDTRPTDLGLLRKLAAENGVPDEIDAGLAFRKSQPASLPAKDASFDFIYSWSVFEHVEEPIALIKEIRRVLRPEGAFMIQLYPFYHSENGSHLWDWFPEGFAQLLNSEEDMIQKVRTDPGPDPDWAEALLWSSHGLNKITLDDLQRSLLAGGFRVSKLELITETVLVPPELARFPLSFLGVAGVKLLAIPLSRDP